MKATDYLLSHLTIVSLLVASTMAIFPGQINANNNFLLTATKKHVSIQADNASLAEILREIENQTGIAMTFDPSLNLVVSTEMVEQPLQVAIDKLAPNNLVVDGFSDGTISIKEVIIMSDVESSSGNVGFEYLPSGDPAQENGTNELQPDSSTQEQPVLVEPQYDTDGNPTLVN